MIRYISIQDAKRHKNIHHRIPSGSEMLGEISSVCRYQKYCVSDDLSHSVSSSVEAEDDTIFDTFCIRVFDSDAGHSDHGRVPCEHRILLKQMCI